MQHHLVITLFSKVVFMIQGKTVWAGRTANKSTAEEKRRKERHFGRSGSGTVRLQ